MEDRLSAPPWDAVPTCTASNTDGAGQGPFFIHNRERDDDVDMFRQDLRGRYREQAEPGTEMQLHLRVRSTAADCAPLAGITDAAGVVSFRSIFPGWYNGRDVHIHVLTLHAGSESRGRQTYRDRGHILTTQFYFEPDLIDRVHTASQPYLRRTALPAYAGSIAGDERNNSGLRAKASFDGTIVVAQMQIGVDPNASRV